MYIKKNNSSLTLKKKKLFKYNFYILTCFRTYNLKYENPFFFKNVKSFTNEALRLMKYNVFFFLLPFEELERVGSTKNIAFRSPFKFFFHKNTIRRYLLYVAEAHGPHRPLSAGALEYNNREK